MAVQLTLVSCKWRRIYQRHRERRPQDRWLVYIRSAAWAEIALATHHRSPRSSMHFLSAAEVRRHRRRLDSLAWHLRDDLRSPQHVEPSIILKSLCNIETSASEILRRSKEGTKFKRMLSKLLTSLNVRNPDDAYDGVGQGKKGYELREHLVAVGPFDETRVGGIIRILGCSGVHGPQFFEAVAIIRDLASRAREDCARFNRQFPMARRRIDEAMTSHVGRLVTLYKDLTGRSPRTSINPITWEAGGPFLRFIEAVTLPLSDRNHEIGGNYEKDYDRSRRWQRSAILVPARMLSYNALRRRVRAILKLKQRSTRIGSSC